MLGDDEAPCACSVDDGDDDDVAPPRAGPSATIDGRCDAAKSESNNVLFVNKERREFAHRHDSMPYWC